MPKSAILMVLTSVGFIDFIPRKVVFSLPIAFSLGKEVHDLFAFYLHVNKIVGFFRVFL